FAAAERPLRSPPYPPYPPRTGLVRFVIATSEHARTADLAEKVAAWLRRAGAERLAGMLTVLGPAPCPLMRLKGKWRWHVLVKSTEPRALGRAGRAWRAKAHPGGAVIVDRDPQSLLGKAIPSGYFDRPVSPRFQYRPPNFTAPPLAGAPDARFTPAPADGVLPDGFFSTTNLPTYV